MSLEGDRIIEAQYYCREMQVQGIIEGVERVIEAEQSGPAYLLLRQAMTTPPIFFPTTLRRYGLSAEEFFETIRPAMVSTGRFTRALEILDGLKNACNPENTSLREVSIDFVDTILPEKFQVLYKDRMFELESINAQRLEQAAADTMAAVEGNVPLARYRRDLAEIHFGLKPGFAGTEIALIPTKIPNVDLKCVYPRGQNLPQTSLVVNPFA